MSNTCPKFIEAGNIEETDKSERIGVEKDEEKEDSNKTRILAELNNDDEVKNNEIVACKLNDAIEIKLDGLDQRKEVKELT
ncbi:20261_t:CDS:2, partial [Gigaspora rosea]